MHCALFFGGHAQGQTQRLENFISDSRQLALFRQGLADAEAFRQELCTNPPSGRPGIFALTEFLSSFRQQAEAVLTNDLDRIPSFPGDSTWLKVQLSEGTNGLGENKILGPFTGPWHGALAPAATGSHPAQATLFFESPVAVAGHPGIMIHSVQQVRIGDGFGWNAIASHRNFPGGRFVLGALSDPGHPDLNQNRLSRPHIGVGIGPDSLLWIRRDEVIFETVRDPGTSDEKSMIIGCSYGWRNNDTIVARGAAFQAIFTRNGGEKPSLHHFKISRSTMDRATEAYGNVLAKYVRDGKVDYEGLKADRGDLVEFLTLAASIPESEFVSWGPDQQLSFLLNLYNAATLQLIIDHDPVQSIKEIGWLGRGPWKQKAVRLWNKTITLDELEHEIIRKRYSDPKIHFALVCGANGCPPLRSEPYSTEALQSQLDNQARAFLNDGGKNHIDPSGKLHLSPIFKWYAKDFGPNDEALVEFVRKYFPAEDAARLPKNDVDLNFLDYDWKLNDRK